MFGSAHAFQAAAGCFVVFCMNELIAEIKRFGGGGGGARAALILIRRREFLQRRDKAIRSFVSAFEVIL